MLKSISVNVLYGLKILLAGFLLVNLIMMAGSLALEFKSKVWVEEVVLGEQLDSHYDTDLLFRTEVNGEPSCVYTSCMTHKTGDTVKVVLRDGKQCGVIESYEEDTYTPVKYRLLRAAEKICGNYTYLGIELAVFILAFAVTFKNRKKIKETFPKLTKFTAITVAITSVISAGLLIAALIDSTLYSIALGYLAMALRILVAAVLLIAWGWRGLAAEMWGD